MDGANERIAGGASRSHSLPAVKSRSCGVFPESFWDPMKGVLSSLCPSWKCIAAYKLRHFVSLVKLIAKLEINS